MQLSSKARKAVAAGLTASTMLWASVMGLAPIAASAAVHTEGCLVLSGGVVWLITGGTRRGFTSAEVFASHGYNFSQVVSATSEDVALPVGPIMTYADGTLVMGPNDPLVYLVSNGQKRGFTTGSVFTGMGYSFANIQVAPVNTFSDLPTGSNIDTASMAHPAGTLVISGGAVWKMTATGRMGFPSAAVFNSYGYSWGKVVAANSFDLAMADQGAVSARPACSTTGDPVSGSVNVSLNGPASSTLVVNQADANLANFVFSGNGTVTSVTLKRTGVSADTTLSNVYLYDGSTRLTDGASVSSGSTINFTGLNIAVNGSRTISAKATMAGTAGETVGVQLTGATLASGSVGGLPVSGNLHTMASATLAGVALTNSVTVSGNTNPGTDILVWQNTATVSTRDVTMTRMALRQIGSINSSDINNFRLFIDGVQVASQQNLDANGYVTFSFNKTLMTGSRTIKVIADVIGGSGRTVSMSLRGAYDLGLVDSQYNAGIAATVSGGSFPNTATAFTVSAGTMTVVKTADSQSSALTLGASDQSYGKFTFTAYGEPIKVETLLVDFTFTDGGTANAAATLRNGRVLVNGSQVGSTTTLSSASTGTSFTTNFTVNPGTPVTVEVRADVFDNDGTGSLDTSDTIKATLSAGSSNGIPQYSLTPINVPSSAVDGNTLTIASGALTLAKDTTYADRNVVVPTTAYKIADFNMTNGNVEDINVNTFTLTYTGAATFTYADLSDVYIKYGSNTSAIKSSLSGTDSFSVNFTAAKNSVTPIEVYANISSAAVTADDTLVVNLAVTATSASGQSANVSATAGQTLTAKTSGTVSQALSGSTPSAKIVSDNQTIDVTTVDFSAVDDSYVITDVTVTMAAAGATIAQNVILKDGSTTLATKPAATSVTFSGLNISVPTGSATKTLTVALQLGTVGVGAGTTGSDLSVDMTTVTARSVATGTSGTVSGGTATGKDHYGYAAIPQVTREALPSSALTTGTVTLAKFTVTSDGGSVEWDELLFSVTKTNTAGSGPAITDATLWDAATNTEVAGADTIATLGITDASGTIAFNATTPEVVSGSKTYLLKATVSSTGLVSGYNINTTLGASGLGYVAPTAAGTVGATATLVWSDRSASSHAIGTSDWNNDHLVKFLPLDSWTLTFN